MERSHVPLLLATRKCAPSLPATALDRMLRGNYQLFLLAVTYVSGPSSTSQKIDAMVRDI